MKTITYLVWSLAQKQKIWFLILFFSSIHNIILSQSEVDSNWLKFDNGCNGFLTGVVYDLDVYKDELYMIGALDVTTTGEEINIAKWNGIEWSFISGYPYFGNNAKVMARLGDTIFIGGNFPQKIIGWNGSNWFSLGNGLGHDVYDIATIGNDVYVGGWFSNAGGVPEADRIAKWDGTNWKALGPGIDGLVYAVAAKGDTLYVGGQFESIGGITARNIAKWDGTNWSSLGSDVENGVNNTVFSIGFSEGKIIVGGIFTEAGTTLASNVAIWDGSNWNAMGLGIDGKVETIYVEGQDIYIGGSFDQSGNEDVIALAKWTGSAWVNLNGSIAQSTVYAIERFNDNIIAGGYPRLGGNPGHLGKWDGKDWRLICENYNGVHATPNGSIDAILAHGDSLFVAGNFETISDLVTNNIALWDGKQWQSLNVGTNPCCINSLIFRENKLYVGGNFETAGGKVVNNIAIWDGIDWYPMEIGFNGSINDLEFLGNSLYAGGNFTEAGFSIANHIAKWNGINWLPVGSGLDGPVYALSSIQDTLYIGGNFDKAGGVNSNNIASYSNGLWSALGNGTNDVVRSLDSHGHLLYAGGYFTQAGMSVVNHTARWDGQNWSPLGVGVDDRVLSILAYGQDIYAGGYFLESKDGTVLNHIGKWDGVKWEPLGSGLDEDDFERVTTLEVFDCQLALGGNFDIAGFKDSKYFAMWRDSVLCIPNCFISNLNIINESGCDSLTNTFVLEIAIDYTAQANSLAEIRIGNFLFMESLNGSGRDTFLYILPANGIQNVGINVNLIENNSCSLSSQSLIDFPDSCFVTSNQEIIQLKPKCFPIPTNSELLLEFDPKDNFIYSIEIVDLYGRKIDTNIYWTSKESNMIKINLSQLYPGIYFVVLKNENSQHVIKAIKE